MAVPRRQPAAVALEVGRRAEHGSFAEWKKKVAGARLVVTDRLHGMILSLVAGTPCLVLPNSNHKIRQTWKDWLLDVPQLKFIEPEQLPELAGMVDALLAVPRRDPGVAPLDLTHYGSLIKAVSAS